jgi:hypothetical protein
MKRHYYMLEGQSLHALNQLIEYDSLKSDIKSLPMKAEIAKIMNKEAPPMEEAMNLELSLSVRFNTSQINAYQAMLGLIDPPIQIRNYGDGALYRAYHVFPQIAMNPGTSKAFFGMGNLLKDPDAEEGKRIAIYISEEDYKGEHFAPPGAVELTEEEFEAWAPQERSFEYYRTYDEGVALPEDFDPQVDESQPWRVEEYLINPSHIFLIQGEAQKALLDYDKAAYDWFMPYQDLRDKIVGPLLKDIAPGMRNSLGIEDPRHGNDARALSFQLSKKEYEKYEPALLVVFDLKELREKPMGMYDVLLVPRSDVPEGRMIAEELEKVALYPKKTVNFGFEERKSLENHMVYDGTITGAPYMQIERFDQGEVKLLALRMPPYVKKVEAPKDCKAMSIDDYRALSGREENLPTHVFRIEGDVYKLLEEYDAKLTDHVNKTAAFKDQFMALIGNNSVDEYKLLEYERGWAPRNIDVIMPLATYELVKDTLGEYFQFENDYSHGAADERRGLSLIARTDTEKGCEMATALEKVPYEPVFPKELKELFGFNKNGGYDLMRVETMSGLKQKVILNCFPDYIKEVETPQGCVPLTREECALILAESHDLSRSSVPPPRPAHLMHLPLPEGYSSYESLMSLKKSKDEDGLALHERTEFDWFKIFRPRQ